jgi:hypothetical protein
MVNQSSQFHTFQQQAVDSNTPTARLVELARTSAELAQLVATNPTTPPQLLQELAESRDATTRKNVTMNPNTPSEVLLRLAWEFPGELLNNPIFALLLLENPNLFDDMPRHTLERLLKYEYEIEPSTTINTQATEYQGLIPEYCLQQLANPQKDLTRRCLVAKHLYTPAYLLEKLAKDEMYVRMAVALNRNAPVYLMEKLAQDREWRVRDGIAMNRNTPVELLEKLAQDECTFVRESIGRNTSTPIWLLQQLAEDKAWHSRGGVARNPKTPVELLEKLARDKDRYVRKGVAENLITPGYLLLKLAQDEYWYVRISVAENPHTPAEIIKKLAQDSELEVRNSARRYRNVFSI